MYESTISYESGVTIVLVITFDPFVNVNAVFAKGVYIGVLFIHENVLVVIVDMLTGVKLEYVFDRFPP